MQTELHSNDMHTHWLKKRSQINSNIFVYKIWIWWFGALITIIIIAKLLPLNGFWVEYSVTTKYGVGAVKFEKQKASFQNLERWRSNSLANNVVKQRLFSTYNERENIPILNNAKWNKLVFCCFCFYSNCKTDERRINVLWIYASRNNRKSEKHMKNTSNNAQN